MTTAGQNFGASAGVDVVWVDDLSQDEFGTSFIVTGGNVHPDESMYSDTQTTTPAPVRGEFNSACPLLLCSHSQSGVLMTLENCDVEITSPPYKSNNNKKINGSI